MNIQEMIGLYYKNTISSQKLIYTISINNLSSKDEFCKYFMTTDICQNCNSKMNFTGFKNGFVCSIECRKEQRTLKKNIIEFKDLTIEEMKKTIINNITKQFFISRKFLKINFLTERDCYDIFYPTRKCDYCEKESEFISWNNGYSNKCESVECSRIQRKLKTENTNILKYGVRNISMCEDIKQKKLLTFKENFGVENISQLEKTQIKIREANIKSGRWKALQKMDDISVYYRSSSFKHGFEYNILTTEDERKLLKENGVYNNVKNRNGCVRDHLLSRRYGFENNIPTWIISHPVNCEIVTHSENLSRASRKEGDNLLTLEELLIRIAYYNTFNKMS